MKYMACFSVFNFYFLSAACPPPKSWDKSFVQISKNTPKVYLWSLSILTISSLNPDWVPFLQDRYIPVPCDITLPGLQIPAMPLEWACCPSCPAFMNMLLCTSLPPMQGSFTNITGSMKKMCLNIRALMLCFLAFGFCFLSRDFFG